MTTPFLRLLKSEDKESALASSISSIRSGASDSATVFPLDPAKFAKVPNSPFAYWVDDEIRELFTKFPPFESEGRTVRVGLQTGDDFRFVRAWWEIPRTKVLDSCFGPNWNCSMNEFQNWCHERTKTGKYWVPFAKGGEYSPYIAELHLVLNWKNDGAEIYNYVDMETGKQRSRPQNVGLFFRPGLTYPFRSQKGFSCGPLPAGSAFALQGSSIFVGNSDLYKALAVFNSDLAKGLLLLVTSFSAWQVGYVGIIPFPEGEMKTNFQEVIKYINNNLSDSEVKLKYYGSIGKSNLLELDANSIEQDIEKLYSVTATKEFIDRTWGSLESILSEVEALDNTGLESKFDSIISFSVGSEFGRFDIRIARDSSLLPTLPDPFDPLPICSPVMLVGTDGLPAQADNIASEAWLRARPNAITLPPEPARSQKINAAGYPLIIPWDGILVDDPDDPRDILTRLRAALSYLHGEKAEKKERELCTELGLADLRDYFRKSSLFFDAHFKRYSKSRRKAPIYWPLQTRDGRYTIWLYYLRLTADTLYACTNILEDKLKLERRKLEMARDDLAKSESKADRLIVEELSDFTSALSEMKEEIDRVAGLPFKPDLDDGVQITASPLWRLFRHPGWQKELKATWEKLEEGDYDWAHLSYSIWSDRVKEKCKRDRSLAIAHGLEDICEQKALEVKATGKKRGRKPKAASEADLDFEEEE